MISEIEKLKTEEQAAWSDLVAYIDFTDKCKRRVYKNQRLFAPVPVPEVEAEFQRKFGRWEKARIHLKEFEATNKAYNGNPHGADGSPRQPSRS